MQLLPDGAALMFYEDLRALKIALDAIMVNKAVLKPVMGEKTLALAEIEYMKLQQFFGGSPVSCNQSYSTGSIELSDPHVSNLGRVELTDHFVCPNCQQSNERRDIECSNCGVLY